MEVSSKKPCNYCKPCEQLKTSTCSEGFCAQCEEEMCQRCFDTHKQFKLNREHRLVQSVEAESKCKETPTFDNCTKHLNEDIKFFCLEHGQVGCSDCMVVSHKPCKVEYILEHIDGYKDSKGFNQLRKDIEKKDIEAKAILGSIRRNKDHVKDVNRKFALDVKLSRDEVISHITKLADTMLKYGDDIMAADLEKIENLEKENESLVDDTNCMRDTLQSESDQPYNLFISSLSYKQNLHLVHDQLERIKENNTIKTYNFTPDCKLRQLMKTCKQLGTLHRSGNEFDYELREKMENVSGSQSRSWSPNDLEIFQHPMCMISAGIETNEIGEGTKILLKSEEKVFDQIAKIDWPIVVVAIAGLYRTGKSYLMNRLAESSKGFALGDTTELKTKGIWAWCKIHPTMSNTVLLLLDTEGLGDVEKGDPSYDNKILTLATLLCNCLVYNMKGAFDNDAVSKLTFVTEMASNIKFRGDSSEDNQSINLILPDFVLCLRDFSLKSMKDGKKITENDYLEQSLAENKSKADQFNKPRACIRKYFTRRECFAFPVPGDGDDLENLEKLSFTQLSTRFKEVTSRFTSYIYTIPPKFLLASKPINGQMFVTLADRYVTAIKHGAVPDVDDAYTAVAKLENAKIEKEALEIFKNEMEKVTLPTSESDLGKRSGSAQHIALDHLRQNGIHNFQANCEIQAQRQMDAILNKIKTTNEQKVREKCENTLQNIFEKYLKKNIENREYETAGGHRRYRRDVERTKDEYVSVLRDFKKNEILSTWYGLEQSMTKTEAKIIDADEYMSQDKEAEQRRNHVNEKLEKILYQQRQAQKDALDEQEKLLEDHYKKLDKHKKLAADKHLTLMKERLEEEAQKENERLKLAKEAAEKNAARYRKEQDNAIKEAERLRKEEERKQNLFGSRLFRAIWND